MNKLIILCAILFLASCRFAENGQKIHAHENRQLENEGPVDENDKLSQGQKRQLDDATRTNIAEIKALLKDTIFERDLTQLASRLEHRTNKLIKECRMQGEDHEVFHRWLKGFLDHLKSLEKTEGNAKKEAHYALLSSLKELDLYFE